MKCERCGQREATFYYQSNINGKVTQVHLCPECAAELGYTRGMSNSFRSFRRSFFDPFSLLEDFGMLSNRMTEFPAPLDWWAVTRRYASRRSASATRWKTS